MRNRRLIATGLAVAAGLGLAGAAGAAPTVTDVEATIIGPRLLEVEVETLRGKATQRPRISVTTAGRTMRATVTDWAPRQEFGEDIDSYALFRGARAREGSRITVRVRACDSTCRVTTHRVLVRADDDD